MDQGAAFELFARVEQAARGAVRVVADEIHDLAVLSANRAENGETIERKLLRYPKALLRLVQCVPRPLAFGDVYHVGDDARRTRHDRKHAAGDQYPRDAAVRTHVTSLTRPTRLLAPDGLVHERAVDFSVLAVR